ncbi:hypothetical protein BPMI_02398c [Candidatus Burkholderia pumila]|uniref:DUF4376 domain-containing protein n=1 Tax=Candidatus Burkholderia pumila TaxID=1090375 RepID=A0ABR5HLS6_9BURK|nr:hypothetical protein BPMI_02398c [Candidatus Burkholderia pumila]
MSDRQAAYDASGKIFAFYHRVDSPANPAENVIDLTDSEWQICLANPGYLVKDGKLIPPVLTHDELLTTAKKVKQAELSAACAEAITNGFASTSLGSLHNYPAKDIDQQNLTTSVLDSILHASDSDWTTPFWCADDTGNWAFRPHTAAQIQQVGKDAKAPFSP